MLEGRVRNGSFVYHSRYPQPLKNHSVNIFAITWQFTALYGTEWTYEARNTRTTYLHCSVRSSAMISHSHFQSPGKMGPLYLTLAVFPNLYDTRLKAVQFQNCLCLFHFSYHHSNWKQKELQENLTSLYSRYWTRNLMRAWTHRRMRK